MSVEPAIPNNANVVVIEMPSWVGDCILATPVLRAARAAIPDARIVATTRPGLEDLLAGLSEIDEWLPVAAGGFAGVRRLARAMRTTGADAALLLPNSFRAALAARLARVPRRVGYARDGRGFLLTHPMPYDRAKRPVAQVDYYAELGEYAFGCGIDDRTLHLAVTEQQQVSADEQLEPLGGKPFVLLNPGGNKPHKRWPADRFAAVANRLAATLDLGVVVSGSPAEADLVAEIVASVSAAPALNLVERGVTLGSLKGVIHRAALVVTNDTGPRHIAAALGTPLVTLFGPTDHRWTTLTGVREHILVAEPFLPEGLVADDHADVCRIDRITVGDVATAARAVLDCETGMGERQ